MEIIIASFIFICCYVFIMTEQINRALVTLTGGVLLLLTGIYSAERMLTEYIDWNTIALLFAMMVLIAITEKTGLFAYMAIRFAQKVRGAPIPLLIGAGVLTGIGSALLDNVTTVLIFVPIMLKITKLLKLPAFPYLLIIIFSSNIGGAATLIGDPPNIMIGQAVEHLTFSSFLIHMAPIAVILFGIMLVFVWVLFRKSLRRTSLDVKELLAMDAQAYLHRTPMLYQSITVLLLTIIGFLLHAFLYVELTTVALSGAILLLLLTEKEVAAEQIFAKIEWVTLFFFIGLFTLVGGLEEVGVIDEIARAIVVITNGDYVQTALLILWVSGLFSGIVDNIPFVAAMIPVVQEFESYGMVYLDPIWWALALGACLGGNATLIGASANVVVAGLAEGAKESISFIRFLLYGFPLVIISLIVATIYLYIRYLLPYIG
ncbi:membrane protein [Virgibacillus pantothenticus]|uniref:Membrane protein n=1 Tax=Virgibacillus pantothenticus TaxID=1473 RepID=A0A0L0QQX8_VIRPA|nr:ArsB/NhaD family transporter [Virgibacillus pantothenticus]KNE20603.1 membrane protein [Virgibacillus pantothenticus]MED3736514.1 ArsB/NhaD family transporter [Virgibacillus pantothenticus]QTY17635.1 ArsB/NhaD family transporter [Virgibacillus pantothenticus]SIT02267.1 possible tyrosine transporter P-protein [Virgibacillus pantothenticus]GIP61518.1 membrane protein [Virgibacillus pantothenticus]